MNLTLRRAAELLEVSQDQVMRWVESDGLPARRVRTRYRFNRIELLEWAWRHRQPIHPSVVHGDEPIRLTAALELGGIHDDLPGTTPRDALAALVEALPLPDSVDRAYLLEMILARESLCPTGIGEGLAIPHPRNPIVLHVDAPLLAIGFLRNPIVGFSAVDRMPVKTLLMIVAPTIRLHLQLLARLNTFLHEPEILGCLKGKVRPETLLEAFGRFDLKTATGDPARASGVPPGTDGAARTSTRTTSHPGKPAPGQT